MSALSAIDAGHVAAVELVVLEAIRSVQRSTLARALPPHLQDEVTINALATAASNAARAELVRRIRESN